MGGAENAMIILHKLYHRYRAYCLPLILLVGFLLRVIHLNYNSPFVDEAQYVVLGQKILAGRSEEEAPFSWVGGIPYFYPPLSALFSLAGGVLGARFLNVLIGSSMIYLMYRFVQYLELSVRKYKEIIALLAAALIAILGIPIYLSRLATYDMLSFGLFFLGFVSLQRTIFLRQPKPWQRENYFFLAAVLFFRSFLAKYFTLIMLPYLALWFLLSLKEKNRQYRKRFITYFLIPLEFFFAVYIIYHFQDLLLFLQNQVSEPVSAYPEILAQFREYVLPTFIFSTAGMLWLVFIRREPKWIVFWGGALSIPIIHVLFQNSASFHQQVFLIYLFTVPLAAYMFFQTMKTYRVYGVLGVVLIYLWIGWNSRQTVVALERSWTNTDRVMRQLASMVEQTDTILSSEDDITVLMVPQIPYAQITGLFFFEYNDLSGEEAYVRALEDGYFSFVLLNNSAHGELTDKLEAALGISYRLVFEEDPFTIYQLEVPSEVSEE